MTTEEIKNKFGSAEMPQGLKEMVDQTIRAIALHHDMAENEVELLHVMCIGVYVSGLNRSLDIVQEMLKVIEERKENGKKG
jgi:hypothetical protein